METKIIYFVHGTTFDNDTKKSSGWKNVELNDLGIRQAKELREQAKDPDFDILITSDLIRAVDSANLGWPELNKIEDNRLRECNYGDFNGEDESKVKYEEHINIPFPNGESLKDVEKRINDFINFIKETHADKTVAIVAHRATQLAFEVLTKGVTWEEAIANDWRKTKAWQPGWKYIISIDK